MVTVPTSSAAYIRKDFIGSFVSEAHPGNWEPTNDRGVFAITQLCLTYWNAAAGLANGTAKAGSLETTTFLADRLSRCATPFGARYRARAAVLYALFRHGLVHHRFPGELAGTRCGVSWVVGRDMSNLDHMLLVGPMQPGESRRAFGEDLTFAVAMWPRMFLGLKPDLLYEHTLAALHEFADDCAVDKELSKRVVDGIRAAKLPRRPAGKQVCDLVDAALDAPDPWAT